MIDETVSVLIPAYNRGYLIRDTLQSIVSQTYSRLDIIVYDDGSTDNTREVVKSFKDDRIRLIEGKHAGVSVARNELLNACKTEIACWQDSDDLSNINRVAVLCSGKDGPFVCSRCCWVASDTDWKEVPRGVEAATPRVNAIATTMFDVKASPQFVPAITMGGEDTVWKLTLAARGHTIKCLPSVLYYIRKHEGRISKLKRSGGSAVDASNAARDAAIQQLRTGA